MREIFALGGNLGFCVKRSGNESNVMPHDAWLAWAEARLI